MERGALTPYEEKLTTRLKEILQLCRDVRAVFCCTNSGLPIASVGRGIDASLETLVSAMSAAIHRTAERLAYPKGTFEVTIIQASEGGLVLRERNTILLSALVKPHANLGLVLLALDSSLEKIVSLIDTEDLE